jgi:hypothetical protein
MFGGVVSGGTDDVEVDDDVDVSTVVVVVSGGEVVVVVSPGVEVVVDAPEVEVVVDGSDVELEDELVEESGSVVVVVDAATIIPDVSQSETGSDPRSLSPSRELARIQARKPGASRSRTWIHPPSFVWATAKTREPVGYSESWDPAGQSYAAPTVAEATTSDVPTLESN